jgi:repressor LexA
MSDRARDILAFIQRFSRDRGYPPTIREIGEQFHIASTNGVRYYLQKLERDGHFKRTSKLSRGIVLHRGASAARASGIPILGRVAAGQPILAEESYEGRLEPAEMFGETENLFALRVRGDSMIDAGILEGDYVVVRQQERASTGEIVVALLEDEATVKYYRPHRDKVELIAANPRYSPITVTRDTAFRILGVVKGVMRVM